MNRQDFEQQFTSISDQIWEFAEPRYQEFHSSALQADFLEKEVRQLPSRSRSESGQSGIDSCAW